jgi:hypothetical protein
MEWNLVRINSLMMMVKITGKTTKMETMIFLTFSLVKSAREKKTLIIIMKRMKMIVLLEFVVLKAMLRIFMKRNITLKGVGI